MTEFSSNQQRVPAAPSEALVTQSRAIADTFRWIASDPALQTILFLHAPLPLNQRWELTPAHESEQGYLQVIAKSVTQDRFGFHYRIRWHTPYPSELSDPECVFVIERSKDYSFKPESSECLFSPRSVLPPELWQQPGVRLNDIVVKFANDNPRELLHGWLPITTREDIKLRYDNLPEEKKPNCMEASFLRAIHHPHQPDRATYLQIDALLKGNVIASKPSSEQLHELRVLAETLEKIAPAIPLGRFMDIFPLGGQSFGPAPSQHMPRYIEDSLTQDGPTRETSLKVDLLRDSLLCGSYIAARAIDLALRQELPDKKKLVFDQLFPKMREINPEAAAQLALTIAEGDGLSAELRQTAMNKLLSCGMPLNAISRSLDQIDGSGSRLRELPEPIRNRLRAIRGALEAAKVKFALELGAGKSVSLGDERFSRSSQMTRRLWLGGALAGAGVGLFSFLTNGSETTTTTNPELALVSDRLHRLDLYIRNSLAPKLLGKGNWPEDTTCLQPSPPRAVQIAEARVHSRQYKMESFPITHKLPDGREISCVAEFPPLPPTPPWTLPTNTATIDLSPLAFHPAVAEIKDLSAVSAQVLIDIVPGANRFETKLLRDSETGAIYCQITRDYIAIPKFEIGIVQRISGDSLLKLSCHESTMWVYARQITTTPLTRDQADNLGGTPIRYRENTDMPPGAAPRLIDVSGVDLTENLKVSLAILPTLHARLRQQPEVDDLKNVYNFPTPAMLRAARKIEVSNLVVNQATREATRQSMKLSIDSVSLSGLGDTYPSPLSQMVILFSHSDSDPVEAAARARQEAFKNPSSVLMLDHTGTKADPLLTIESYEKEISSTLAQLGYHVPECFTDPVESIRRLLPFSNPPLQSREYDTPPTVENTAQRFDMWSYSRTVEIIRDYLVGIQSVQNSIAKSR